MDDERLKQNLASSIAANRKRIGLTQLELSEKINYSDKSVSKWERGEGIPDIATLVLLSELFQVTPNDLIFGYTESPREPVPTRHRLLITLLAAGLVWLVAAVTYLVLNIILLEAPWLGRIFLYAIPVTCIVSIVFTELWWGILLQEISVSALVWSAVFCIVISLPLPHIELVYLVAGILQVLIILWFIMKRIHRK